MTTPSNTIEELVGRVEAATGPDRELAADICEAVGFKVRRHSTTRFGRRAAAWAYLAPDDRRWHAVEPILSSIDAALALLERVLPGCSWAINGGAQVVPSATVWPASGAAVEADGNTSVLAIILATLRSLQYQGRP